MAEIAFAGVTKRYDDGHEAVRGLDLQVDDGELVIFVGPSGCGKTTALRMVAGLETITDGEIRIGGRPVNDLHPKQRDIAMVFQNYALYPHMKVRDNVGFALKIAKRPKDEIGRRVGHVAELLDLLEHLDRRPSQLSGGQRQRVAMGRAIVREPRAFLMDEPLSNLDAKLRVEMRAAISRLQQRLGTTTIYVTHDQVEALTLGQRVAVLRDGLLQQFDTPKALYERPRRIFVAGFIGSPAMNFAEGDLTAGGVRTGIGEIPLPGPLRAAAERARDGAGERRVVVGIRPEHLEDAALVGDRSDGCRLSARIELIETLGSETHAHFAFDAGSRSGFVRTRGGTTADVPTSVSGLAVARLSPESRAAAGASAELWLDTRKLHVFDADSGESLTADTVV